MPYSNFNGNVGDSNICIADIDERYFGRCGSLLPHDEGGETTREGGVEGCVRISIHDGQYGSVAENEVSLPAVDVHRRTFYCTGIDVIIFENEKIMSRQNVFCNSYKCF